MLFVGISALAGSGVCATLENPPAQAVAEGVQDASTIFINEYRIDGARKLPRRSIEEAVYPFLGPGRTKEDVEQARSALEQAYHDQGFQTVLVQVPEQQVKRGIVHLQVVERTVGRLRVKGAKYSSPSKIKAMTPSLAEGSVINFNQVPAEIVALDQMPDRQVTPTLRTGVEPDTVDVDLEVTEKAPLHASTDLNNRHGPDTTALRVNASVSANNLWQAGHGAGFSFQVSPQDTSQVKVFSAYYLARFAHLDWFTLTASALKQDSDVSTLGEAAVTGRGSDAGLRADFSLPPGKEFSQSASLGITWKRFDQRIVLAPTSTTPEKITVTPITYFPLEADYNATWQNKRVTTDFNAGVTFHLRGLGDDSGRFNNSRSLADANFLYFHGELSQTRELPWGFQIYGKVQGQIADQPLLSGEQATGGGLGTARGYLEAEAVGDSSFFGTVELRSPSLLKLFTDKKGDWRLFAFSDAGWLKVNEPPPEQKNHFDFLSYGVGTRLRFMDHFDGLIVASFPQLKVGETIKGTSRISFKAEFDY